jgi:peptidoglycan-N-acetylglucosamine deacetylase
MQKQIFQTNSPTRWKSFVWLIRILIVFLIVISTSVVISLLNKRHYDLKVLTYNAKKLPDINTDKTKTFISKAEQIAFAKQLALYRRQHGKNVKLNNTRKHGEILRQAAKKYLPVRAGFYVNWDVNSIISLEKNIDHLNMIMPEWLFQKDAKGNIESRIEKSTVELINYSDVPIIPMLSNYFNKNWNGDSTYEMLKDPKTRRNLILNIKKILVRNKFQGINIDFESLPKKINPYLIQFSKELQANLQPAGLLTTIDIDPEMTNITYKELAPYYDFIFVMAYNEHYPDGEPGSIASLGFVEKALDDAMREVPSDKVVLCVAAYGFDWQKGKPGTKMSYQGLISLAKEHEEDVYFNMSQSDLTMMYNDDDGNEHEVHCNDACGIFNTIRTAQDYNAGGIALWYLGSEDDRIWKFYSRNMNERYLDKHPFNFKKIEFIQPISSVIYDSKGEILEMLSEPTKGDTKLAYDKKDHLITDEEYLSLPSSYLLKRFGASNAKKLALTFDDGPDGEFTPKILDVLKDKKVPATFFVTGGSIENNIPLISRMYNEGHEIGNHTFTHPNLEITSENRERIELRSTRLLIESILGHSTLLFRPPYNTDAEPKNLFQIKSLAVAHNEGFISVTSYIDPNDWEEGVCADTIIARAIARQHLGNVILLHDAGGDRSQTAKALPVIIDYFKKHGFQFVTVSALMNKTRDQVMPEVHKDLRFSVFLDLMFFTLTFLWEHFLHGFFIVAIFLVIIRLLIIAVLAIIQRTKEKRRSASIDTSFCPKVSIIVPGYNEEVNAARTVENLLQSDYPNFEVVFVDDGSKDNTYQIIKDKFEGHPKVQVFTKENGGKATALNVGIQHATGEIMVCIDADTILKTDAVSKLIIPFSNPKIGAVAGNVKVGNTLNALTNWQSIEYITSQNFDRRAFDTVNAILVVPGAIGAFRKNVIEEINGFKSDTLAEDCDLTLRILRAGYIIKTSNEAIALTEAPETLNMFMKQRLRWTFGMMQSFWKHRDLLFSLKKTNIGWAVLPNLLLFNFLIPLFSPLVDIMFIVGVFTYNAQQYILFYLLYYLVDCIISMMAYKFDNQKFTFKTAIYLFIQRFIYRQLLFFVLYRAYKRAIKGELISWGVLKRTGNVKG